MLNQALQPGAPLASMAEHSQFILWTTRQTERGLVKLPVSPRTAQVCNAHDASAWVDAPTALQAAAALGNDYGVGFVFTASDPFWFVDIDKCLEPSGQWSTIAVDLMSRLTGAAVEVSQSGKGLHIFGKGEVAAHACKNVPLGLELYTEARFVALTGSGAMGDSGADLTGPMAAVVRDYYPTKEYHASRTDWNSEPCEDWSGPKDDAELIRKALKSKSAGGIFGASATFKDLWEANVDALSGKYPDDQGVRSYDESSADAALAQHLAFWTGRNHERILGLMRQSGLVRDKWNTREDYLPRTIVNAAALCKDVYQKRKPKPKAEPLKAPAPVAPPTETASHDVQTRSGYQLLAPCGQKEHFEGCVYVRDEHKVYVPDGGLIKPDQFRATYGGYLFVMDSENDKTTKNAWEAFTESQVNRFPFAHSSCFRPDLGPGELSASEGYTLVNTYKPVDTPRKVGDATPFLRHLANILPDEQDQKILLSYMAAVIQHKGVKFRWAPLLQGIEGNGKTLFSECVMEAIGHRYSYKPRADGLGNNFNSWLRRGIFIGVDDIHVPGNDQSLMEVLKPLITEERQEIESKGIDQTMTKTCANFMFNSNHPDAVRKSSTDRRFCVFYTNQQRFGDLERDGMDADYFEELFHWLKVRDGFAIVHDMLATYAIPAELNPAGKCQRAPRTSTTDEVLKASRGGIEQEVIEATEEGRTGFCGGWVSSLALGRLLDGLNAARTLSRNKRHAMMEQLGYHYHPALKGGRVNSVIVADGGKPKLYIKRGHSAESITEARDAAKAYEAAQLEA